METRGNPIPQPILFNQYVIKQHSLSEIALNLDVSVHKVTYWMRAYKIPTRSQSEAIYLKQNPHGDPFKIKKRLTIDELKLKYLALGLYWGEGSKANKSAVKVGNTDPNLIKQFRRYLLTICGVRPTKVHYWLQTFKDMNLNSAKKYWSKHLNISVDLIQANKTSSPPQGKGTYRRINRYGVLTIAVSNTKLRQYLEKELDKLGYTPSKSVYVSVK